MKLARYRYHDGAGIVHVGVLHHDLAYDIGVGSMAAILQHSVAEIRALIDTAVAGPGRPLAELTMLAPIDGRTEVWGAGVTYRRSRTARAEESRHEKVYVDVYDAERPELFFKSVAWRALTDGDPAGIRQDSTDSVAEPELALVLNRHAEIVGAVVCNDLTARSIEGENPIYLPQAKIFRGSCALSSAISLWWELTDPEDLAISLTIHRDGAQVFFGQTRTSQMKRSYDELVYWLFRAEQFPDGVVLSTGTGIVPELGDTLMPGDVVTVAVDQVGSLTNTMTSDPALFEGLISA